MTHSLRLAALAGALAILVAVVAAPAAAQPQGRRQDAEGLRLAAATRIVSGATESGRFPQAVADKAEGIIVFPQMPRVTERAGTGPNTRRTARLLRVDGRGILSVRGEGGAWSAPAFVNIIGDSVPRRADLVLVVLNRRTLDSLMQPDFTVSSNTAVASGPTSGDAAAWTEAQKRADILAYSHGGGALQGAALAEGRFQSDTLANQRFYGKTLTTTAAVAQTEGPPAIASWRQTLQKQLPRR